MDPALASLLGAVVGGLIGGGSNVTLDWIRAGRDHAAGQALERRDARRAARVIAEELESGRRLLAGAVERGHFTWEPSARQLPAASWELYRSDLALVANEEHWAAVSDAYAEFDGLNWHVRAVIEEEHWTGAAPQHPLEPRTLGPTTKQKMGSALAAIGRALDSLHDMRSPGTLSKRS